MTSNEMAPPDQQPHSQPEESNVHSEIQLSDISQTEDQSQIGMLNHSQPEESNVHSEIQLSDISQTEDQSQVGMLNHSESRITQTPISKVQVLAIISLTIRAATWLCLLESLIFLACNTSTISGLSRDVKVGFNKIYAYRYMMSAIVIGFAYTCVLVILEIYQVTVGKSLATGNWLPKIIFYGDKFLLSLLATGVGAAFGITVDSKNKLDHLDDYQKLLGNPSLSQIRSKLDNFFNLAYVSTGFLLIAFLSSIASSILSSLALSRK